MGLQRLESDRDDERVRTAIAIGRDKHSPCTIEWAADNLMSYDRQTCLLIHVRTQNSDSKQHEGSNRHGRAHQKEDLSHLFLPFRGYCARKGIRAKEVLLHDVDVSSALINFIIVNSIANIVVGAGNRNPFMRKFRDSDVSSILLKHAPETCSVYVVSKGRLHTSRPANQPQTLHPPLKPSASIPPTKAVQRDHHFLDTCEISPTEDSNDSSLKLHQKSRSGGGSNSPAVSILNSSNGSWSSLSPESSNSSGENSGASSAGNIGVSERANGTGLPAVPLSHHFQDSDMGEMHERPTNADAYTQQQSLEAHMRRLKRELKQTMELYQSICDESIKTQQVRALQEDRKAEEIKLDDSRLKEGTAMALAELERHKARAAIRAAELSQQLAQVETHKRKHAELIAKHAEEERKKATNGKVRSSTKYRRYTIEEIEVATNYFSNDLKIGEGGYGPVYRAIMDHTEVAIKVLRPDLSQGLRQFNQEVEVLSTMRHPNMVLLLGACPEYGCLVYEYMENGTLEDRLFRKGNTPPLPWRTRFRIAAEIATALLFLHSAKPEPLVHRDLKPANVLLGRKFVSKISDVGLARLVPPSVADSFTHYHMTAAAGTFCYIDPEYQQTGMLGVKSDLYSLGVVLLQIITARPPVGLSYQVEQAIERDQLRDILDPEVPDWPQEEALQYAKLALKCCELQKKDRPDLATVVLPQLRELKACAMGDEISDSDDGSNLPLSDKSSRVQVNDDHEHIKRGNNIPS